MLKTEKFLKADKIIEKLVNMSNRIEIEDVLAMVIPSLRGSILQDQ